MVLLSPLNAKTDVKRSTWIESGAQNKGIPCTFKTPTCILLNEQRQFEGFEFEAAEKYAMSESAKVKSLYYFDNFKMMLYE